ncbi:MAG: SpoIIE family protein phosphatase [Bacteroidota bacterium]
MKKTFAFLLILLSITELNGQHLQDKIDSLHSNFDQLENDSLRIRSLNFLSFYYDRLDTTYSRDSAIATIKRSYKLATQKGNYSYSNYPFIQYSELSSASSNYDVALKILLKFLDIAKTTSNIEWEALALREMVILFNTIQDKERTAQYIDELKKTTHKMKSSLKKAHAFNAIGSYYKDKELSDSALFYHEKALKIRLNKDDSLGISFSYNNIGLVYKNQKKYDLALEYYKKSLKIKQGLKNTKGMAGSNINIGQLYLLKNKYQKGIPYVENGIELTKKVEAKNFQLAGYKVLYKLHRNLHDFQAALKALETVRQLESEIHNNEQIKLAKELERKYNAEKLEQKAKINELELENSKVKLSQQQNIIWFLAIGVAIFILLIVLVFINYRQKKKINQQLEENNVLLQKQKTKTDEQNVLLARKNKEITDSINYAKRIQEAILPSRYKISENIQNGFIMFQPKDVVSGDFYWIEEKDNKLFLAAADCTGHGVPGAMVSVICSNALSKALLEENLEDPAELLNQTRAIVINQFQKSSDHVNDGMDISLAVIDREKNMISWAGANNPLWIIRHDQQQKIEEFRPDKQPVGIYHQSRDFTSHQINIAQKDRIYLFSDGFVDQFGGASNKKFKPAQFRRLLIEIQELPIQEQKYALKDAFKQWKGDHEQVDDVCVIGYEI